MRRLQINQESLLVLLSFLVQLPLAVFLGHFYDQRVFMATGYLVSAGLNPYQPHTITGVFPDPLLSGTIPIIGYPPLWSLLLGAIYRLTFNLTPNLFLYNFAIKIPVMVSNIGLAYIVKKFLQKTNASQKTIRFAWLFLLFNPFILLTTTAWGQFDSLIALLCVVSIYFLSEGKIEACAFTLALSIALKPVALPLIGFPILFCAIKTCRKDLRYTLVFTATAFAFSILLFYFLGWSLPLAPNELTSHFRMAGGITPFNLLELFTDTRMLPAGFELLGWMWLPAVIVGYYAVYRNPPNTMSELAQKAASLLLIFFLTRSWLSEQNINLLFPLMLITLGSGKISKRSLHFLWIIPLVFMFLNFAFPQLFFLVYPQIIPAMEAFDAQFGTTRFAVRFAVTVLWYILGIKLLLNGNKSKP